MQQIGERVRRHHTRIVPRGLLLAAITLCALAAVPTGAQAATTVVPNACQYNVDNYYRDINVTMGGDATIAEALPRYPAPTGSVVDPGQTVTLAGAPLTVTLPSNLPKFGYMAGLLAAGPNTLTIKVWVAVKATNTLEDVQIQGPITLTATTTIEVDTSNDDRYVSDNGITYTPPTLAPTTWTATGGDIAFSQAPAGALGSLPVGNAGANRNVAGSVVIQAIFPDPSKSFFMDCQPGAAGPVPLNPVDEAGPSFTAATPAPIDNHITGPRNASCISAQGRLASGPAANLTLPAQASANRELDPIVAAFAATGFATSATAGTPYTLSGATAHVTLSADTIATLANFADGATKLIASGATYPLDIWVALKGTNTAEDVQTVHLTGTYSVTGGPTVWPTLDVTLDLPPTTWTPSAAGAMAFSVAPPGSMAPIELHGLATTDPLGDPATTAYTVNPYGSLVLRLGTARNATTFDCVIGGVRIANTGIDFSNLGRLAPPSGSQGRYTLYPHAPTTLASVSAAAAPGSGGGDTPPPPPPPPPPPVTPPVTPPPPPPSTPPVVALGTIGTSKLSVNAAKTKLKVSCPRTALAGCKGKVQLRSVLKLRLTPRGKAKIVTIARDTSYTVAAGKSKTLTLTLGSDARRVLRGRTSLRVKITLKPASGKTVTRTVTLTG
jgi:hypothetical protein